MISNQPNHTTETIKQFPMKYNIVNKNNNFVDYFTIKNRKRQLTHEELKYCINFYNVNLILYNQKLTPEFIVKHIWNQRNNGTAEDSYLTEYDILHAQPHISVEEWNNAVEKFGVDE